MTTRADTKQKILDEIAIALTCSPHGERVAQLASAYATLHHCGDQPSAAGLESAAAIALKAEGEHRSSQATIVSLLGALKVQLDAEIEKLGDACKEHCARVKADHVRTQTPLDEVELREAYLAGAEQVIALIARLKGGLFEWPGA